MDREIKTWLFDILNAIEEIEQFLPQGNRLFEVYKNDLKTKRAVERNLENKLQDLRLAKQVPAVIYGKKFEAKHISVSYSDFLKTFRV